MRTIKLKGHKVELYDNIEDLPIVRFQKYNKMLLIDSGCGSDMADFDRHIERISRYTMLEKKKEALAELDNLRNNVYFIQQGLNPSYLAFAALVKSVDGKSCDDLSDDGLCKVVEMLSGVTHKEMTSSLEEVKKKIDEQLNVYFPNVFDNPRTKEYYDIVKSRTLSVIHGILGEDTNDEIERKTSEIITFYPPQSYNGTESVEIKQDKDFERMCIYISQHTNMIAKDMSVSEYYNSYDYLSEQAKQQNKKKK